MVITDLDGNIVEGTLRPSSDLATHPALYNAFPTIGGVVHTHSRFATAWAQAGREIPCFGTTHADYFHGPVPVTEPLPADDIQGEYELNTGVAIIDRLKVSTRSIPRHPGRRTRPVLLGRDRHQAAHNAVVVEELAALAFQTILINPNVTPISRALHHKHHSRKHGPGAYYGQK